MASSSALPAGQLMVDLAIAKTAFTTALFRPDAHPCSRAEIDEMFALLSTVISECSNSKIQKFTQWAVANLVPSTSRIAAFCSYIAALSKLFGEPRDPTQPNRLGKVPSAKRRRVHMLYILNDILHNLLNATTRKSFAQKLEPTLPSLIKSASSFLNSPKHSQKIQDLILHWKEEGFFDDAVITQLRAALSSSTSPGDPGLAPPSIIPAANPTRVVHNVLPPVHGDASMRWYDLPAGTWLRAIQRGSTRPMNPSDIAPIPMARGTADPRLVEAVTRLIGEVEKMYGNDVNNPPGDIDRMGEFSGETYYGWSPEFCEKMRHKRGKLSKNRNRGAVAEDRGRARSWENNSQSRSQGSSYSPEPPASKRPRLTKSPDDRGRIRSPIRRGNSDYARRKSRSPNSSSRSGSDRRYRYKSPSYGRSMSRSRSRTRSPYPTQPANPPAREPPQPQM
ncbi:hypothetical protein B0H63DRAFT_564414, partial [Podospora didyma]